MSVVDAITKATGTSTTQSIPTASSSSPTDNMNNQDKFTIQVFENSNVHAVSGRQSARDYNQDYFLCRPVFKCSCRYSKEKEHDAGLYIVSDGHGMTGETAAEQSSRIMESIWRNELLLTLNANDTQVTMEALKHLFKEADKRLVKEIDPRGGTTCTFAFIHDNQLLYIANVGDSSAKLYKRRIRDQNNQVVQVYDDINDVTNENSFKLEDGIGAKPELVAKQSLISIEMTTDHKPQDSNEKTRIENLGGSVFNHNGIRVEGVLNMSRALGNQELKPFVSADPSVRVVPLSSNHHTRESVLVLASDGLWAYCEEDRILAAMNKAAKRSVGKDSDLESKPRAIVEELGDLAKRHRSSDNLTIVAVMLDEYLKNN